MPPEDSYGRVLPARDRCFIRSAGEMPAGCEWPRSMSLTGLLEQDGTAHDFDRSDGFNAYQAERQARPPWSQLRAQAVGAARSVHALFARPALLDDECLGHPRPYAWGLPGGERLTLTAGWFLWLITLEHEGVDHVADLALDRAA